MDSRVITNLLKRFAKRHSATFSEIAQRQSMLLELGAVIGVQEHYRAAGFDIRTLNPRDSSEFVVKTSTRGAPWNYSRIRARRDGNAVDIHMNLMVRGAHDEGVYCVDVGIANADSVPLKKSSKGEWICLENRELRTFAEVKRLVVYPMLLAQFVGIVHEIKPRFLVPPLRRRYGRDGHIPPTLIVLGHFSGNSREIVRAYEQRHIQINIAESFDVRVAWARSDRKRSPLYWEADDEEPRDSRR